MLFKSAVFLVLSTLLYHQTCADPINIEDIDKVQNGGSPISDDKDESLQYNRVVTSDVLKQMMWKKCASKGYMTCMKLAVVQMVDKLDKTKDSNYQILPGITIIHSSNATETTNQLLNEKQFNQNNMSELLDQYLMTKISGYLENLSLNVKVLDDNVMGDIKSLSTNDILENNNGDVASGRAKSPGGGKKSGYGHYILMAAIASGGTLMALAFKTIALLAGKALITSLISLAIAAASALKGHGHHSEPKSTTYEIVTKPIVTHTDAHHGGGGGHGGSHDGLEQGYATYKRSIDVKLPASDPDVDKVVYRIHTTAGDKKTPLYIPIETSRR